MAGNGYPVAAKKGGHVNDWERRLSGGVNGACHGTKCPT